MRRKLCLLAKYHARTATDSNEDQSSPNSSYPPSPPNGLVGRTNPTSTFFSKRSSASALTDSLHDSTLQELDQEASQLILDALERNTSQPKLPETPRSPGSFGKFTFSSMMGGLSALSLTRSSTITSTTGDDKESRGRSIIQTKYNRSDPEGSRSHSRARSQSPFSRWRFRSREPSPAPLPVPVFQQDGDLSDSAGMDLHRAALPDDQESGDETNGETDADTDDEDDSFDDVIDPLTERNTERNAETVGGLATLDGDDADVEPDPLGEGVNVVVPCEPYFPSTLNFSNAAGSGSQRNKRNPRRRKTTRLHDPLPINNSRPTFQRDRCTIVITQGDPDSKLAERKRRTYIVASDLSEESRYAVQWGIGTVLKDGDEMMIVTILENEHKVDPEVPSAADRAVKLRSQQERQGLAYILMRQSTSLLQRTRLHVRISCEAWHAKNARHILLDIVDYHEPTMLIVGSRGLGRLKGILLGSTSHYLIQKCSVPVMVARRRLKRPPRRSAHLSNHRAHVSLAEAGIDRVVTKVDRDTKTMREELSKNDDKIKGLGMSRDTGQGILDEMEPEDIDGGDDHDDDEPDGSKVAG